MGGNSDITNKVLTLIKPDAVKNKNSEQILQELDQYGDRAHTSYLINVPQEIIEKHYEEHKDKPFYDEIVNTLSNQPFVLAVYHNLNMPVEDFKEKVIGKTNPDKALEGTIRAEFGTDMTNNGIHCSDPESYDKETKIWLSYALDQPKYYAKKFEPETRYNKPTLDLDKAKQVTLD